MVNNVRVITITDSQGNQITINGGNLQNVRFADGSSATLSQLLAPSYTQGTTLYSQVNATAANGITAIDLTGNADISATANGLNDVITANSGSDTLIAGTGADTLIGNEGFTTYQIATGNQITTIEQSAMWDTLSYGNGVTAANLTATAATASDGSTVVTLANNLGGTVVIDGGVGNEVDQINFAGGSSASLNAILAQATSGSSAATSATSVTLAEGTQNMILTGTASITATGNDEDNVISANSGNDTLIAGTGEDTLIGSSGSTTYDIEPGSGNVTITHSSANDILLFGTGLTGGDLTASSTVVGGQTVVTITDDAGGTITIDGGGLNQVDFAGGGSVTLSQLAASSYTIGSTLYSQVSTTLPSTLTNLVLTGTGNLSGADTNSSNDELTVNSGNDTLTAGSGNDTLNAGSGNDSLVAGFGNDVLNAGSGNDTLVSGAHAVTMNSGNLTGDGSNTTTFEVDYGNNNLVTINAGPDDTLLFGAEIEPGVIFSPVPSSDGPVWTTELDATATSVTINGSPANIGFTGYPDNISIIPFSTYLSGNYTYGQTQYASTSTTLAAGLTNLILDGESTNVTTGITTSAANLTGTANNLNDRLTDIHGGYTLVAGSGNDTLVGANDTLVGGAGVTTFITSGSVTIENSASNDILELLGCGPADAWATTTVVNNVTDYVLSTLGGTVTIAGGALPQIEFAYNTQSTPSAPFSVSQFLTAAPPTWYTQSATLAAGVTNAAVAGTNLTITANNLNDIIGLDSGFTHGFGFADTYDTLVSGAGNDTLDGYFGVSNTYLIAPGSGTTTIMQSFNDILAFGAGVTAVNILASSATVNGMNVVTLQISGANSVILA